MATKLNRNFAKFDAEMHLVFAPDAFKFEGRDYIHPTAEDYTKAGFLPVIDEPPADPAPEGMHWEPAGWIEEEGSICMAYKLVEAPPPPPRRWSRLNILIALGGSNVFEAAVEYLKNVWVKPNISAWMGLNTANFIEEGYGGAEAWNALLNGAAQALGKTREEIDAFFDAIPTEG